MSATNLPRPTSSSKYRVAAYHDGNILRIHEFRRRSHVTGSTNPPTSTQQGKPPGEQASTLATEISSSSMRSTRDRRSTRSRNGSNEGELRLSAHVTSIAHTSPRAKAIISQSPIPLRPKVKAITPLSESSGMPTPPSTPKMGRMATPELEDLDEIPFCDCCVGAHFVNYCASCGSGLQRL